MVDQRAWTRSEFWDLLVAHPLIGHLVRRLVCLGDGVAFRVTGSGAVDAAGADVELDEDALIRIAHPLALADLDQWIGVFASMEIAQPFPQLVREVFTPRAADEWAGQNVESAALFGLERRGWMRGKAGDAATLNYFIRPVPGGDRALAIMFEPGFAIYDPTLDSAEQTLGNVHTGTKDRWPSADVDFATIDPILASEIARDLLAITSDWPLRS